MSSHSHNPRGRVAVMLLAVVGVLCSVGTLAVAQDQPAPKWELFGGDPFVYPGGDVHGLLPLGVSPVSSRLESNPRGIGASLTYDFNRWFGLTGDISGHWGSGESGLNDRIDDAGFYNLSLGPKITFRSAHFSPFLEALVGDHRLEPDAFQDIDRLGLMFGGGLDVNVTRHFALRLLRADYVMSSYRYGPSTTTPSTDLRGVRLQSGLVFMWGGEEAGPPVSASCTINPSEVMVGEPATATAAGSNFNPRHTLNYTWSSTGGQITGKDNTASINTNGVAGGRYTVTAHISDARMKKGSDTSCMASFTVKEPPKNPPAVSCSADPSTVRAGTSSTISCTCTRPDEIVATVAALAPSFGGINLEDISAPRCFEIEDRLRALLDIPVFHDDQHGTAIVTLAALRGAARVAGKEFGQLRAVVAGAGAAGVAVTKMLLRAGIGDIAVSDSKGLIYRGREGLNPVKAALAERTNRANLTGSAESALAGADVFIGLSSSSVAESAIAAMAPGAIVFALSNPDPEVHPEAAGRHALVVATGRSDFPNQINNSLAFPGVFRGALDTRATDITDGMKLAAADAIAALVGADAAAGYGVPSQFDQRVAWAVADAVAAQARADGVARR